MMRLSTLWKVDRRLDDANRSPIAQQILARWEHDPDSARFVRSSANFVFRFSADGVRRFLRFADSSERTRQLVEAETDLVEWLAGQGADVARPLPSRNGTLVETVPTAGGTFHAVVFAGVSGTHLERAALDLSRFEIWGAALGELHATLRSYSGPAHVARPSWRDQLERALVPAAQPAVRRELDQITASLEALPADRERCGLIHGDFELDNLCWKDDPAPSPAILDFDDCSHHWYAADIAFALRDLFDAGVDPDDASVGAFLRGYRSRSPLEDQLLAALSVFSRLARLLGYTTLIRSLDLPHSAAHPPWLTALRQKFERRTGAYAASLAK